jgi:hypothetical protein
MDIGCEYSGNSEPVRRQETGVVPAGLDIICIRSPKTSVLGFTITSLRDWFFADSLPLTIA